MLSILSFASVSGGPDQHEQLKALRKSSYISQLFFFHVTNLLDEPIKVSIAYSDTPDEDPPTLWESFLIGVGDVGFWTVPFLVILFLMVITGEVSRLFR